LPAGPPAPQAFAVFSASATSREAPRALFAFPDRNRVAAITGRDSGVDTIPISAFRPFTPE